MSNLIKGFFGRPEYVMREVTGEYMWVHSRVLNMSRYFIEELGKVVYDINYAQDNKGVISDYILPVDECSPSMAYLKVGDIPRVLISPADELGYLIPDVHEVWKDEEPLYPFKEGEFRPFNWQDMPPKKFKIWERKK